MNLISSYEETIRKNMSWPGSGVEVSAPMAGNNAPGVVADAVEDVSNLTSEAHLNSDDEDFALDHRIIFLLSYATKDSKRDVLYLLEPAAEVALENDVSRSSTSAYVDQRTPNQFTQDVSCPRANIAESQRGTAVDHHSSLSYPTQTQTDPMHWARQDQGLSEVHKAPEGRRYTYSSNDSGRPESIQVRTQAHTAPEPYHVAFPQTDHNTQFPHPKVSKGIAVPIPSSRLRCGINGCYDTFKGKAELKRHEDSKHLGKNYTCMFPACSKYDQKFRIDKIKPHIRECHSISVRKAPKSWYWPWQWYSHGHLQGWICGLCGDFLGTWDLNRRQICSHIVTCINGDDARKSRWKGSGAAVYVDDEDISRAFRLSLNLGDPQGSANIPGPKDEEDSSMVLSSFDDTLFGEY